MKELVYHRGFIPATRTHKDSVALIDGAYEATYAQHADRVFRLARALKEKLGVSGQDRFAVLALNSHAYVELYHAAFLGAGVINPLNLRLSEKELDYIVRDSGAEVVFVDQMFAEKLDAALKAEESPPVRKVVLIGEGEGPCDIRYEDLLDGVEPLIPEEPEEDEAAVLMYTGGTTGLPKGVLLTHRAIILNSYHVRMSRATRGAGPTVNLCQTPMFHVASMPGLVATYTEGGTIVTIPAFEPALVLKEIERRKVTSTLMVPTMIGMMFAHPEFAPERIASLDVLVYGASPMPPALLQKLLAAAPDTQIFQGYGMTESSASVTLLNDDDHRAGGERLRSVGRPVPGVEVAILDEDGNELGVGEIGEVCAKGGNFMREYWNKPDATQSTFRGGWYHTGDAGYLDADGYLFLVDRVKDMIISGGENIYSVEVENAISNHPDVAQVAAIGIPDERWGEAVHAVVVLKDGATLSAEDVIAHARKSIAGYKTPKSVEFRTDPLPLSAAMKVLKQELRAPFWEGRDRSIA